LREERSFPEFYAAAAAGGGCGHGRGIQMLSTGPITYKGHEPLRRDLDNFAAALTGANVLEAFVPAISPGNIEHWQRNAYSESDEAFLYAIVDAGLILQIDDPRLATYYAMSEVTVEQCRCWAAIRVEALNHALRGIPEDRVRFHTCYSINMGPRVHDMELRDLVDIVLRIRAGAYSFEAANPRHEHEWQVWEQVTLPAGKLVVPGVISHTTVLVEHPELVAQRLEHFARVVGRENVIAGADCGFATFATSHEIHPSVVWAKLQSVVDGAAIAGRRLFG
jgi:5-methyltetrahydropteroyltriglutamate--homocysteine methyltransferase